VNRPVIPADPGDAETLAQVIADAFHDLPPARWLIPDPAARSRVFPAYFRIFVDHALAAGIVHTTPHRAAVALWLPVSAGGPGPPGQDYPARLAQATGRHTGRFAAFDAALDEHHPTGTAHQHLAMLAVRPGCQGQGIGTALLAARHAALDQAGTPAYLEASSPRNRALYQRHGYVLRPNAPIRLPDGGPPMWPMWRPAT
jgi:GNAT superfamily N-acetyltransferase